MALKMSTMPDLGSPASPFSLPNVHGDVCTLQGLAGPRATVVMFLCNHCPFVNHIVGKLSEIASAYSKRGVAFIAINSNDASRHAEDAFENMKGYAERNRLGFEYLFDESQDVAKAYAAACTPDFFVYDERLRLIYRGQFDESRPKNNVPVCGRDLIEALDLSLAGGRLELQKQSIGCSIKWKDGNEPDYYQTGSVR